MARKQSKAKQKAITPTTKDLEELTKEVDRFLGKFGPLYVAALYPQDIADTPRALEEYTPWFIAHCDETKLSPNEIDKLWQEFCVKGDSNESDALDDFSKILQEKGYIILTSAVLSDDRRNYGYLTVNRDDIEGELDEDEEDEDWDDDEEDEDE